MQPSSDSTRTDDATRASDASDASDLDDADDAGEPSPVEHAPSHPSAGGPAATLADDAVSAFLHAPIAVAVCAPDGTVTRTNPALTHLLGYPSAELVGRDLFRLVEAHLVQSAIAACASLSDGTSDTVIHDTRFHTHDGRLLDVRVTTSAVRADRTRHPHAIMHLEDITDREDLRRRLQHEAAHDPLTGLCNRARFVEQLQRALPRGRRHEQSVTVLYLDLDDFKAVNDTHGHATGDQVLIAFSDHIRASLRPEDIAARLGGDEFAVLCEDTTLEQVAAIIERLTTDPWATAPWATGPLTTGALTTGPLPAQVQVTVTVGAATSPGTDRRHLSAEQLLHEADAVMYAAKAGKRT